MRKSSKWKTINGSDMRTQMDKLMNDAHKATADTAPAVVSSGPQVKLVPLTAQDDIESYLITFERIMEAYTIPKEQWMYHLAPQQTGKPNKHSQHLCWRNPNCMRELKRQFFCDMVSMKRRTDSLEQPVGKMVRRIGS